MSNYIEELTCGDSFSCNDNKYVLTCDHKKDGSKLAIDLMTGLSRWLKSDTIVEKIQLFIMDKDNCIVAIKETKKDAIN